MYASAPYCNRSSRILTDEEKARIIKRIVAEVNSVPYKTLESGTRKREYVEARQIAMVLIRENTRLSLKKTGSFFGNRDHSTVCHANTTVSDLLYTDKAFEMNFNYIKHKVKMEFLK